MLCYDARMEKKDILHLARLSRIAITDEEAEAFLPEIESILAYVGVVSEVATEASLTKKVGARYNVLREDVVTTLPETYSEKLLEAAPKRAGRYISVKKILHVE
jgi:aspartyl-tRNA(Asn)/glutamyl-tRNA(Gln) amidotransferase subunit C